VSHDPFVQDGAGVGIDLFSCMFCDSFSVSDLHIDAFGEVKRHVREAHPSDWAAVMNAVDETMAARDAKVKQAARDYAFGRRN
jgi:hypothetical protein